MAGAPNEKAITMKAGMYLRFASGLGSFLRTPTTLERASQVISARLNQRESNLVESVKTNIYANQDSPYLKLLKLAGCEFGDFEELVRHKGVEETLEVLCGQGVYVSLEEFKGIKEAKRGSSTFTFEEKDFDSPAQSGGLELRSGASRSSGTRTNYDIGSLTNYSIHRVLELSGAGAYGVPMGIWMPILPGGGPRTLLTAVKVGLRPVKWFSQVGKPSGSTYRDRLVTDSIVFAGRCFGFKLPMPEYVPLDRASYIADWVSQNTRRYGGCFLNTYPSSALRVCQAAREKGLDVKGLRCTGAGEPFTEGKRAEIEAAGAIYTPSYASVETGIIGLGCTSPASTGEVHLLSDALAVTQHLRPVPHSGVSVDAFLVTTLLQTVPKVFLNTETGDYGQIGTRRCGCHLEKLGLATHISEIRGFDKLTAEGMTLVGTNLVRIIEEVLPSKFGGGSTDYQIVEEEQEDGHTRMNVLASPELGEIDENELVSTILAALPHVGITPNVWSMAGTLRVKRIQPMTTERGKLLPLHIVKRPNP